MRISRGNSFDNARDVWIFRADLRALDKPIAETRIATLDQTSTQTSTTKFRCRNDHRFWLCTRCNETNYGLGGALWMWDPYARDGPRKCCLYSNIITITTRSL